MKISVPGSSFESDQAVACNSATNRYLVVWQSGPDICRQPQPSPAHRALGCWPRTGTPPTPNVQVLTDCRRDPAAVENLLPHRELDQIQEVIRCAAVVNRGSNGFGIGQVKAVTRTNPRH